MPSKGYKYGNPFKFKYIKIYSSSEWMANSTKKYRKVFDKDEVSYIRVQFSFYNKLFDEEDWNAKISIKTFDLSKKDRTEIFVLDSEHEITKDKNVVDIYESWGVETNGGFWKKGKYVCEAYIDDILVGSENFFIEDVGIVTATENPYFDVVSVKLFSGSSNAWETSPEKRRYLTVFNQQATQYVWVEFTLQNKTNKSWNLEYYTNFYNEAGQHKAQIDTLRFIDKKTKDQVFTFDRGWGNNAPGSWKDKSYYVEIIFMDVRIASVSFETGEADVEGLVELAKATRNTAIQQTVKETGKSDETLEQVLMRLEELIGLKGVKQKIRDHISYLDFIRLRKEHGFEDNDDLSLHSVFTGNPGTGKTTVVKLLGKIYQKMGLLSKGHVHEVDRADLVGEFIGQTAPKVKDAIAEARGGILFIDEAYMLYRSADDKKDFGKEVIEVLVREMSDGEGDLAIMMAGYPKETNVMIESNPGLKSRIKYHFIFDDYMPDELLKIAEYAAVKRSVKFANESMEFLKKTLVEAYRNRDRTFGNARYAYSLIDEGKMNMGLRLIKRKDVRKLSGDELSTILYEDVEKIVSQKSKRNVDIPVEEQLLKDSLQELNSLVGLNEIKNSVNDLIKLVRYYRESGKDVLNKFSMHTVFTGNPGTGKTTVARIMGKIYKALGLLEKGHVVETGKDGLIAGYVGQTAIKTKEKLEEAMGGVLFIDEAYALTSGGQNSFGGEAIEVILKQMEDKRGFFAVIVAGYPENMDVFLRSNPGLKSRFDKTMHFNDYDVDTLYNIAIFMLETEGLLPDDEAEKYLREKLADMYKKRDKYFGNARSIRKLVENAIREQNLRMASIPAEARSKKIQSTLTLEDLKKIKDDTQIKLSSGIGF